MTQLDLLSAPVSVYTQHRTELAAERTRLESGKARILARLRRGPATNVELVQIAQRATGRMSELRAEGYQIEKRHIRGGVWEYELVEIKP